MKWCKESVKVEALKYSTRVEFKNNSSGAYGYALRHGIIDDVCKHMKVVGDKYHRFIYKLIFPNINSIYIGLTYNFEERKNSHITNSSNRYVKELLFNDEVHIWVLEKGIILQDNVGEIEKNLIREYEENGWNVLNISPGGGLGGGYKWNYELVKEEAKKYTNRRDFRVNSSGAYYFASRHKYLNSICFHMKPKWSLEEVKKEAIKYNNRSDFSKYSKGAYYYAYRNKILDEVCEHMLKKN